MMFELHRGDCLEVMRRMPENSVDSVVTDPPYGLKFMGKRWDCSVPSVEVWRECLRVLKPGGYLLAFAGTRTQHHMATGIESAGFEIRDMITWVYGSGFPKSKNLGGGVGSALKPALEPITVARKPFAGSLQDNYGEWGTGGLNIDVCRVTSTGESRSRDGESSADNRYTDNGVSSFAAKPGVRGGDPSGRWPANLIHDGSEEVLAAFPDAKGQQGALTGEEPSGVLGHANTYGKMDRRHASKPRIETDKSAARFFYCAKASKADRDDGCAEMENRVLARSCQAQAEAKRGNVVEKEGGSINKARVRKNNHPTVKPTTLMRYLCRLVTPPGGIILDPFMGSGSTGKAAVAEDFQFIGIELDPDDAGYFDIAKARIRHEWNNQLLELGLL